MTNVCALRYVKRRHIRRCSFRSPTSLRHLRRKVPLLSRSIFTIEQSVSVEVIKKKKGKKEKKRKTSHVLREDNAEDFGTRIKCDDGFTVLEWSFTVEVAGSV